MARIIFFLLSCLLLQLWVENPLSAQQALSTEREIEQKIDDFYRYTSPQKVYLHLNKNNYNAGDAIWFKAYLFDGTTHSPDTASTNLYVELVSSRGLVMEKRILLTDSGFSEGDISLSRDLPDGNYRIRAYTDWMRNFGEEYYYSSYFYIHNKGYANIIPRAEVRSNRRFNRELEGRQDMANIVFFPEGGRMVENVNGRVAFKAFDGLGRGLDVEGEIINDDSEVVASFRTIHAGTGSFELKPSAGKTYTARVSFDGNRSGDFALPQALAEGMGIRVWQDDENILLETESTYSPGQPAYSNKVTVIAHTRGRVIYGESITLQDGKAGLSMSRDMFPSGVTHITVFSGGSVPLAERLVFVYHDDAFVFYPDVNRQKVGDRDYYVVNLDVTDKEGDPVAGHFSLSVLHTENDMPEMKDNILSNLLINSDLPGIFEEVHNYLHPGRYLPVALDHLMMTHGWRRFVWEDVLSGTLPEINYPPASSLAISGKVIDPAKNQILPNFPVDLKIRGKENGLFSAVSDKDGIFLFDNLKFHDNVRIRISSDRLVSNHPPSFELHAGEFRNIDYVKNPNTLPYQITGRGDDWQRIPGAGRSQYAGVADDGTSPQQYGTPDQTVYIERDSKQPNMYDILITRVRGLNHNLQFRGPTSMHLSSTPLFMLDGTEIGQQAFLNLDPRYIERLEIFSGPRASIFGVRGANGAILGYTRRAGDPGMSAYEEFLMQGYHSPREYFSDFVSSFQRNEPEHVAEKTVHWEPNLVTDDSGTVTTAVPVLSSSGGMFTFIIEGSGLERGVGYGVFSLRLAP